MSSSAPDTTTASTVDAETEAGEGGDLNKRRRLNAIFDARHAVVEARRKVDEALHYGEINQLTANTILRREVENYIHEVEWIMDEADTAQDYEGGVKLGSMVFPDGTTYEFVGLESILELADPIEVTWETVEDDDWDGRTVEEHRERVQIPRDVLMNAYRAVNGFLFEIGLDLGLDDGAEEFGFDYSHLAPGVEEEEGGSE